LDRHRSLCCSHLKQIHRFFSLHSLITAEQYAAPSERHIHSN